jgi:hypothetical protein
VFAFLAAGSDDGGLLILEGRQPAVLVNYLRTLGKGRENTATLFLHCSVREQVLRFVKRDASASPILHFLRVNLPAIDYADMAEVTKVSSRCVVLCGEPVWCVPTSRACDS